MLGKQISDPDGMEEGGRAEGLGLLPVETFLTPEKITVRAHARLIKPALFGKVMAGCELEGYEIHLGRTEYHTGATPVFAICREGESEERRDGVASSDGLTIGTYLHGLFDSDRFRHTFIGAARTASGLTSPSEVVFFAAERESRFDRLAACVRDAMNVEAVLGWLELGR